MIIQLINDDMSLANGIKVYDLERMPSSVIGKLEDGEVEELLSKSQFKAYLNGEFTFKISNKKALEWFNMLPYYRN